MAQVIISLLLFSVSDVILFPHHVISVFNFCPNVLILSCRVPPLLLSLHFSIPLVLPVSNGGSSGQTGWCNPRSEEPRGGFHRQSAQWHPQSAGTGTKWANRSHRRKLPCFCAGSKSDGSDGKRTSSVRISVYSTNHINWGRNILARFFMAFLKLHKSWPPVQNRSSDICENETFSTHEHSTVAGHIFHKCNGWRRTQRPLESNCIHKGEGEMSKTGRTGWSWALLESVCGCALLSF